MKKTLIILLSLLIYCFLFVAYSEGKTERRDTYIINKTTVTLGEAFYIGFGCGQLDATISGDIWGVNLVPDASTVLAITLKDDAKPLFYLEGVLIINSSVHTEGGSQISWGDINNSYTSLEMNIWQLNLGISVNLLKLIEPFATVGGGTFGFQGNENNSISGHILSYGYGAEILLSKNISVQYKETTSYGRIEEYKYNDITTELEENIGLPIKTQHICVVYYFSDREIIEKKGQKLCNK